MTRDFDQLYAQLGLRPDCTIDEFRLAYRRRIAALHPDKGPLDTMAAPDELSELLRLYAAANHFYQHHGRLPGARHPITPPVVITVDTPGQPPTDAATALTRRRFGRARGPPREGAPHIYGRSARTRRAWGIALLVFALALALALDLPPPNVELSDVAAPPAREAPVRVANSDFLRLGMDKETVMAIQGQPSRAHDDEWGYGPSWVRFERGQLSDWHSSPLRPLKTATAGAPFSTEGAVQTRR